MRIVLDANVILAAYHTQGLCAEILEFCLYKRILAVSPFILDEIKSKMAHKFHVPGPKVRAFMGDLKKDVHLVDAPYIHIDKLQDETDAFVISTALASNAGIIVSGDGHLLELGKYKHIKIMSPRQFAERFL